MSDGGQMTQVVVVADDLTGAADTGAAFVRAGLTTLVSLRPGTLLASDVLVISTDSRGIEEEEARSRVRGAAETVCGLRQEGSWVYKKVDSTLRGHAGAELAELAEVLGVRRVLVSPAFPDQKRTTIGGHQLLNGVPLEDTSFGSEVPTSNLLAVFGQSDRGVAVAPIDLDTVRAGADAVLEVLQKSVEGVFVADAETDEDLTVLARAAVVGEVPLLCGSAGLARALSRALRLTARVEVPQWADSREGPVLTVAGSRHPATTRQVERAVLAGVWVIRPDEIVGDHWADQAQGVIHEAESILSRGQDVILTTVGINESLVSGRVVAGRLAWVAHELVLSEKVGGLVLTGGDVAMALCEALGASNIWLGGEVEPGAPWGRLMDGKKLGLRVVTKAGGFGRPGTLLRASHVLKRLGGSSVTG